MTRTRRYEIELNNRQDVLTVDERRLREAVRMILTDHGLDSAEISLAVITDEEIHQLNRKWLDHDEPTDVLSFLIEQSEGHAEGEVIVSADTAVRMAPEGHWMPEDELLLYVIHGMLHLVGYDDLDPESRAVMRSKEAEYLARFGLSHRFAHTTADDVTEDEPSQQKAGVTEQ